MTLVISIVETNIQTHITRDIFYRGVQNFDKFRK